MAQPKQQGPTRGLGLSLAALAVLLQATTVWVGIQEPPNKLAIALLQCASLTFGVFSSYVFGKISAHAAAQEMVRPHARSAFRRTLNIYRALGRQLKLVRAHVDQLDELAFELEPDHKIKFIQLAHARASLALLEAVVVEQISTADDSVEDWRDLVPEDVAQIELLRMEEVQE